MFAPQSAPEGSGGLGLRDRLHLTDPPIKALRKVIPPLNLGGVSLDLAFMAVLILIVVLQRVVIAVFW